MLVTLSDPSKEFQMISSMKLVSVVSVITLGLGSFGCGKLKGTAASETPAPAASSSGVSLASAGYNLPSSASFIGSLFDRFVMTKAYAATTSITSIKLCITKLKLTTASGTAVSKDSSGKISVRLGLVDLGDGTTPVTWGTFEVPADAVIKKIAVEVHKDPESCGGAQYSAMINDQQISKDLEFKFVFANETPVAAGDTLKLALTTLASKLDQAVTAGQFNDESVSHFIDESIEDSAEKTEKAESKG